MANLRGGVGVAEVIGFIARAGGLAGGVACDSVPAMRGAGWQPAPIAVQATRTA